MASHEVEVRAKPKKTLGYVLPLSGWKQSPRGLLKDFHGAIRTEQYSTCLESEQKPRNEISRALATSSIVHAAMTMMWDKWT